MRAIKVDAVTAVVVGLLCVSAVPAAFGQQPAPQHPTQPQPQQVALPAGKATCCGCGCVGCCGAGCWPNAAGTALTQSSPTTTAVTASTLIARIVPSTKILTTRSRALQ